jgi:hypothetical protein
MYTENKKLIGLDAKTTPIDADVLVVGDTVDSDRAKKTTWANIKATLKAYFDTLYTKCSGADINTGTDDTKFATSKAISDSTIVKGHTSSTANAIARYNSTSGKLLKDSTVIISDTGDISNIGTSLNGGFKNISGTNIALNAYTDLSLLRTDGGGNYGILMVGSYLASNSEFHTMTHYAFMSRGTGFTATPIGTKNGPSGGVAFTISMPSNGVIRVTNNDAGAVNLSVQFIGSKGA